VRPGPRSDPVDPALLIAARTLALDATTARLAAEWQRAGIRCILLKGPALSRWLYDKASPRDYVDIDLLLAQEDFGRLGAILTRAGFGPSLAEVALPHGRIPHADTWQRGSDGLMVDLHRTLPGVGTKPKTVWTALAADTEAMSVDGAQVEVLSPWARALLVALHAAHHGVADPQPLEDLARALAQLPETTWLKAAALAERLQAIPALAAGLRLLPEGGLLADRQGLPVAASVETILRSSSAPELALSLDWLTRAPGLRAKVRLIARRIVPPVSVLRGRSRLARRGTIMLVAAYAIQPFWLAWHAVPALRAWLAARKRVRA
jgi:Uncharacterised nucleotidyltransferase